jgi:hypothetical protein
MVLFVMLQGHPYQAAFAIRRQLAAIDIETDH